VPSARSTTSRAAAAVRAIAVMGLLSLPAWGGCASDRAAESRPCDRVCLEELVDQYLAALAAHDPSSLPLADNVVFVENNQRLPIGDGTWRTITGLGTYRHDFADPESGQAAVITVVEERGTRIIYDLRLKVENRRIAEVEAMVVRDPNGARLYEELGRPLPIFLQSVPPAERASRADLLKVANQYLSGMENNDPEGDYSFFADDCNRLEHARQTTNMPREKYGHSDDDRFVTMTCRQQFETGFLGFVTRIRDRRYVVVDEERQTVFGFVFLDHNGTVRTIDMSNGTVFTIPPYFSVPRTLQVGEAWRMERGKLRQIEMTLTEFPYGTRPAFETGDAWLDRRGPAGAAGEPATGPCDRECLTALTDRFLEALVAHDPGVLPLSATTRYTENGQRLGVGDGLWGTMTAIGADRLYLANPATGEAGYFGAVTEHDTPGLLAARLRIDGGLVTDMETIVIRRETAGDRGGTLTLFAPRLPSPFDPARYARQASVFGGIVPASDRMSGQAMVTTVLAHDERARKDGGAMRERRPLVVDEERGLVLEVSLFDIAHTTKTVEVPHVGTVALTPASTGPFSVMAAAVYKVVGGRVSAVESAVRPVPYGMSSGWQ
jgi:hypothetical protein